MLEAAAQEHRAEIVGLDLDPPDRPDTLGFTLSVQPVAGGDPFAVSFEVAI